MRDNAQGKLKSPLFNRSIAVREANDLLALTQLRQSRPWSDNDELDSLVAQLRSTAGEKRLTAEVRLQALKRLTFIELGAPELGAEPVDDLIRKFAVTSVGGPSLQGVETMEQVLKRLGGN